MTEEQKNALIELAQRTMEIAPIEDYERAQMGALDKLAPREDERLLMREAFWHVRAERLGLAEVAA